MDGIPYEVYKYAHPAMINLITENFNFYYSKPESLPTYFGTSSISLLHKKGDISDPAMFRPISLLPTIWKLFSSVLTNRLNTFICNILSKSVSLKVEILNLTYTVSTPSLMKSHI